MARRGRPPHPDILTPREWDVLALLREGASNDAIAGRLGITERTAKFHVSEILGKLGVASREEAAAWQPEPSARAWVGALLPFGFILRKGGAVIAGGLFAVTIGGAALIAFLLARNDGGASSTAPPSLIAFSAGAIGNVYTVRPDGSDLKLVIGGFGNGRTEAYAPALSPDARRIAFISNSNIWAANSDGSDAHSLADVAQLQTPPNGSADNQSLGAQSIAWSPDGKHIAYVLGRISGSGVQDLWVMNSDGSSRKELSREGGVWEQPVWLDNDRVSVVAPAKILVFSLAGEEQPAIDFLDQYQQFSLGAQPVQPEEWLVGPITEEGPITLGSADTGRKTVATGVGAALAPGGRAFAYFKGDTLHVAETGSSVDEQILDLSPLGGRGRFAGEPYCAQTGAETCGYLLPQISWAGTPEATGEYLP
jgi:DNA-binding CsgD family transcriptional regulator